MTDRARCLTIRRDRRRSAKSADAHSRPTIRATRTALILLPSIDFGDGKPPAPSGRERARSGSPDCSPTRSRIRDTILRRRGPRARARADCGKRSRQTRSSSDVIRRDAADLPARSQCPELPPGTENLPSSPRFRLKRWFDAPGMCPATRRPFRSRRDSVPAREHPRAASRCDPAESVTSVTLTTMPPGGPLKARGGATLTARQPAALGDPAREAAVEDGAPVAHPAQEPPEPARVRVPCPDRRPRPECRLDAEAAQRLRQRVGVGSGCRPLRPSCPRISHDRGGTPRQGRGLQIIRSPQALRRRGGIGSRRPPIAGRPGDRPPCRCQ